MQRFGILCPSSFDIICICTLLQRMASRNAMAGRGQGRGHMTGSAVGQGKGRGQGREKEGL